MKLLWYTIYGPEENPGEKTLVCNPTSEQDVYCTLSGWDCPTFGRQVLRLVILNDHRWYVGGTQPCFALDATQHIPKLKQQNIFKGLFNNND